MMSFSRLFRRARGWAAVIILLPFGAASLTAQSRPRLVVQIGHTNAISDIAHVRGDSALLTVDEDVAKLWSASTGRLIRTLRNVEAWSGHRVVRRTARGFEVGDYTSDSTYALLPATGDQSLADDRIVMAADGLRFAILKDDTVSFARAGEQPVRLPIDSVSDRRAIAFGPDVVVVGGSAGEARVFGTTGVPALVRALPSAGKAIIAVGVSPDGRHAVTCDDDLIVRIWDIATGTRVAELGKPTGPGSPFNAATLSFSPDGSHLVVDRKTGNPMVLRTSDWRPASWLSWDWIRDPEIMDIGGPRRKVAFSGDGRLAVLAGPNGLRVIEARTGRVLHELVKRDATGGIAISSMGQVVSQRGAETGADVWDATTLQPRFRLGGTSSRITSLTLAGPADSLRLIAETRKGFTRATFRWDMQAMTAAQLAEYDTRVIAGASADTVIRIGDRWQLLMPEGRWPPTDSIRLDVGDDEARVVLAGDLLLVVRDSVVNVVNRRTRQRRQFRHGAGYASDDLLVAGDRLFIARDGIYVYSLAGARVAALRYQTSADDEHYDPGVIAATPDGRFVLNALFDGGIDLWSVDSARIVRRWKLATGSAHALAVSPDGQTAAAGTETGEVLVWRVASPDAPRTVAVHEGTVTALLFGPDGRLYSGGDDGLVAITKLDGSGVMARLAMLNDSTWAALDESGRFDANALMSLSAAMQWVLPAAPLAPVPVDAFMKEFYTPRLLPRLLSGESLPRIPDISAIRPLLPEVRVVAVDTGRGSGGTIAVTLAVKEGRDAKARGGARDLRVYRDGRLVGWRDGALPVDPGSGEATIRIDSVQASGRFRLTAYAFDDLGLKGPTTDSVVDAPWGRSRRAYIVSVGVNEYSNPAWNLRFAANDARLVRETLYRGLRAGAAYDTVVPVSLISDAAPDATNARKASIREVLRALAGESLPAGTAASLPGASGLQRARPGDLVVVSLSTHGYADSSGTYYLVPQDIGAPGPQEITPELIARSISSEELAEWLRGIDADVILILDACHSAAAIDKPGFVAGPFNSPGLGQLAWEKGMKVLVASQSSEVALEVNSLQQGLLTYALVQEGMARGLADRGPADGRVSLGEWLDYGVQRVPRLYLEIARRGTRADSAARGFGVVGRAADRAFQRPSLFDYSRATDTVSLGRIDPAAGTLVFAARELPVDSAAVRKVSDSFSRPIVALIPDRGVAVFDHYRGFFAISGDSVARFRADESHATLLADSSRGAIRLFTCGPYAYQHRDSVRIADAIEGRTLAHFPCPRDSTGSWLLSAASVGRDGKTVAIASASVGSDPAHLWLVTSNSVRLLDRSAIAAVTLRFSPDGRVLFAGDEDGRVTAYDATGGKLLWRKRVQSADTEVNTLDVSPDGKTLLTPADSQFVLALRDAATGAQLRVLENTTPSRISAFSPDGRHVVAEGRLARSLFGVMLVDLVQGRPAFHLVGARDARGAAFSADGTQVVLALPDGRMMRWRVPAGSSRD